MKLSSVSFPSERRQKSREWLYADAASESSFPSALARPVEQFRIALVVATPRHAVNQNGKTDSMVSMGRHADKATSTRQTGY